MIEQTKFLVRVGLGKPFVRKFERDLNAALLEGWTVAGIINFSPVGFFRFLLWVKLVKSKG